MSRSAHVLRVQILLGELLDGLGRHDLGLNRSDVEQREERGDPALLRNRLLDCGVVGGQLRQASGGRHLSLATAKQADEKRNCTRCGDGVLSGLVAFGEVRGGVGGVDLRVRAAGA